MRRGRWKVTCSRFVPIRLPTTCGGKGGARFFNSSPAQALVWRLNCIDHSDALRREIAVKRLSKKAKEALIRGEYSLPAVQAEPLIND